MYSVYQFIYRKCGKNLYRERTVGAKDRLQSLRGQTGEWIIKIVHARNPYRYRRGTHTDTGAEPIQIVQARNPYR